MILAGSIVEVIYYDHHDEPPQTRGKAADPPSFKCWAIGRIVYEDAEWIRLCHDISGVDAKDEVLEVTVIRKSCIITRSDI